MRTRRRKEERFRDFTLAYSVIKITDADDDVLEEKENNNDKQSPKRMERIKRSMLLLSFYLCVYEAEAEVRGHSSRSRVEDNFQGRFPRSNTNSRDDHGRRNVRRHSRLDRWVSIKEFAIFEQGTI